MEIVSQTSRVASEAEIEKVIRCITEMIKKDTKKVSGYNISTDEQLDDYIRIKDQSSITRTKIKLLNGKIGIFYHVNQFQPLLGDVAFFTEILFTTDDENFKVISAGINYITENDFK